MKRVALALALVACGGSPPPPAAPPAEPPAPAAPASAEPAPAASPEPATSAPPPAASAAPPPAPAPADDVDTTSADVYTESVNAFFKGRREELTKACWLKSKSAERAYAGKATIRVGPRGKVLSTKTEGTDEVASACVDKQIKKWTFPPPTGTATVAMPIRLKRD